MDTENESLLKRSRVRTNLQQQTALVNYMCANVVFAKTHTKRQSRLEWKQLAKTLNTLGHPKSILQWVKVWNDLKRNTKKATLATPPGQRIQLTVLEERILDLLQTELFRNHPENVVIQKKSVDEKYVHRQSIQAQDMDSVSWDWDADDTSESKNEADSTCGHKSKSNGNEEKGAQRRVRGNASQANYMLEFMKKHKEMAQYPTFKNQYRAEWSALTRRINVLGPKRTSEQWKKVWRGHRRRAIRYFDEHGHDPSGLKTNTRNFTLQILDILDLNDATTDSATRLPRVLLPPMEDVKSETEEPAEECHLLAGGGLHSTAVDGGSEDTPVVSWEWDPVGSDRPARPAFLSPAPTPPPRHNDDDDDAPLSSNSRLPAKQMKGLRQILKQMEVSRSSFHKVAEKQTALLEKLLEQSVRNEQRQTASEQRSIALQERMVALQDKLVALGERTMERTGDGGV